MTAKSKPLRPKDIQKWMDLLIEHSSFEVKPLQLTDSTSWLVIDGAIRHSSGLFFNVVGVSWDKDSGRSYSQPFIEQREVGSLGFLLLKEGDKNQLLVQAKIEPGNVGVVQLAPTYQATASNAARVHGGKQPLYPANFYPRSKFLVFETLQSEQGSRFLGKQNRNILSVADSWFNAAETHGWFHVDELLELLIHDNLVNTDARSVLVCCPWEELVSRVPFSRHSTAFAKDLQKSYQSRSAAKLRKIEADLNLLRSEVHPIRIVDINRMSGWRLTDYGLEAQGTRPFDVRQIQVTAKIREVPVWDQPIIDSKESGYVDLVCGRRKGLVQFLFCMQREPGLHDYVELSPTFIQEPGIA
ncbi:NDP-hexose 2,3-dehydratase family protein, partial [Candidatus Saccharibacteria bacterium]|nr:NDP-hexose 2,3-dehydratase family protein [Candidatus Saccharibacteria bacterium]